MKNIELLSRLIFLVLGTFHFLFNFLVFEINYFNSVYVWKMNSNSIGEANIEAVIMIFLLLPFLIGLCYFINDFKQILLKDENNDKTSTKNI